MWLERFWQKDDLGISFSRVRYKQLVRITVDRCFLRSQAGLNMPCRQSTVRGYASWENERIPGNAMEQGT